MGLLGPVAMLARELERVVERTCPYRRPHHSISVLEWSSTQNVLIPQFQIISPFDFFGTFILLYASKYNVYLDTPSVQGIMQL